MIERHGSSSSLLRTAKWRTELQIILVASVDWSAAHVAESNGSLFQPVLSVNKDRDRMLLGGWNRIEVNYQIDSSKYSKLKGDNEKWNNKTGWTHTMIAATSGNKRYKSGIVFLDATEVPSLWTQQHFQRGLAQRNLRKHGHALDAGSAVADNPWHGGPWTAWSYLHTRNAKLTERIYIYTYYKYICVCVA